MVRPLAGSAAGRCSPHSCTSGDAAPASPWRQPPARHHRARRGSRPPQSLRACRPWRSDPLDGSSRRDLNIGRRRRDESRGFRRWDRTAQVKSCPSTHTNTFIDTMSTTIHACDHIDGIVLNKYLTPQITLANSAVITVLMRGSRASRGSPTPARQAGIAATVVTAAQWLPSISQTGAPRPAPDRRRQPCAPTQVHHPDWRLPAPKNRRCAPWSPGTARR